MVVLNTEIAFKIIPNNVINNIPIVINSLSNDSDSNVKSTKLGGTKFNVCSTCSLTKENGDMGHPGRTPLKGKLVKPGFIKSILETLNSLKICHECKMIKSNEELGQILKSHNYIYSLDLKKDVTKLIQHIKQSVSKCQNSFCLMPIGTYKYNYSKGYFFVKLQKEKIMENDTIYAMLKGIPNIVYKCLTNVSVVSTFCPYEAFYTDNILIMVNPARPPNYYDNKDSHIMTTKLNQLVGAIIKDKSIEDIQKIYNDIDHVKPRSPYLRGSQLDTLNTDVSGSKKAGLIRSNILARRADNTARGVAGPANIKIGYLCIPRIVAETLTEAIYYNRFTENMVRELLYDTSKVKYITLFNYDSLKPATMLKVKAENKLNNLLKLRYGDKIECSLSEYSIVIFSRQPSLHKFNIQAAFCLISDSYVFSTPTPIANSMNLDYDGDELNIYKPKSPYIIESALIMLSSAIVKNNYNLAPAFGLIQDQLLAIHILYNQKQIYLLDVIYILNEYSYFIRDIDKQFYTGQELLSLIFPTNTFYKDVLNKGKLILSSIDSTFLVSQSYKSFANIMSQLKNNVYAVHMIDILLTIARNTIKLYGFSIPLDDIIPDIKFINSIYIYVDNCCKEAQYLMSNYYKTVLQQSIIVSYNDLENARIENGKRIVNAVTSKLSNLFDNNTINTITIMKNSKYKVTNNELCSILGCNGQQGIDSELPATKIMGRIFDFNVPGDIQLESLGFIKSSILKGMTFSEMCFHAKYNSIKKILKITCETSLAGSVGRKLVKFLEHAIIDDMNRVVLNGYVIWDNPNYLRMKGGDMCKVIIIKPNESMINKTLIQELYNKIKPYLVSEYFIDTNVETVFPINIESEIRSTNETETETMITDEEAVTKISNFIEYISLNMFFNTQDLTLFKYILLTYLDRGTLMSYNLTLHNELINSILQKIKIKLMCSISPGYAIGYEYAHTIQEKFTQQALSSFHTFRKSGVSDIQAGFTEFKDVVELGKKGKPDMVTAYSIHKHKLQTIKSNIEFVCLKDMNPTIKVLKDSVNQFIISIQINKYYLYDKATPIQYLNMFNSYMHNCIIVSNYWITMNFTDIHIEVIIGTKLKEPYNINKLYFIECLSGGVGKGNVNNINIEIEPITMYDIDNNKVEGFSMQFYVNTITDFSNFDTKEVFLKLTPWFAYEAFGIQAAEYTIRSKLVAATKDKSMEICYNLLAKLMCQTTEMYSIKKLRDNKNSIIKHAIHGSQDAIINAAYNNIIDPINDAYSSILLNKVCKLGHGYFKSYINLNSFDQVSIITKEEEQESIKSEIIENF